MSNTNEKSNKSVKSNRAPYGFELIFPQTFTLRDLRKAKSHKIKYSTIYARVKRALESGEIVISGDKAPAKPRRGRKELVYTRADAKETLVTATANAEAAATV